MDGRNAVNPEQDPEDKIINQVFQDWMRDELRRPEIKRDRENFIREHFKPAPAPWFRPQIMVPAMAFAVAIAVFGFFLKPVTETTIPAGAPSATQASFTAKAEAPSEQGIKVKRASSKAGSVMVYHRRHEEVPITIVWVFPTAAITS